MINVGDLLAVLRLDNELTPQMILAASLAEASAQQISNSLSTVANVGRNALGQFQTLKPQIAAVGQTAATATPQVNQLAAALGGGGGGGGAAGGGGGGAAGGGGGGGLAGAASGATFSLATLGRGVREIGFVMTAAFTVPIVQAAKSVTQFGSDFETQMIRVTTLAGAPREQVKGFTQEVMNMAQRTGIESAELAKGLYVLLSTGQSTGQAMKTLEVAAQMSALGMGSMHDATLAITGAMFSFKNQNLTAADAANTMIKAVRLGNMEIQDLVPSLAKVNPLAAAMGISFEDVAASLATFTHSGADSSVAATGLRAMLANILTDSAKTEKGFKSLAQVTGDMSITMDNFVKEMKDKGMTQAMVDLTEKANQAGDAGTKALNSIFPNIRALTDVLFTYKTNGDLVLDILDKMRQKEDTLGDATALLKTTFNQQWNEMMVSIHNLYIEISTSLLPIFLKFVNWANDTAVPMLKDLIQWFNGLPMPMKEFFVGLFGFLAAIGPAAVILGSVAQGLGNIAKAMALMGGAQAAAGPAALAGFLANPYVLGGAVILIGIALAVAKLNQNLSDLSHVSKAGELLPGLKDANGNMLMTTEQAKKANAELGALRGGFSGIKIDIDGASASFDSHGKTVLTLTERVAALTEADKAQIRTLQAKGFTAKEIADEMNGVQADVVGVYERSIAKQTSALKVQTVAAEKELELQLANENFYARGMEALRQAGLKEAMKAADEKNKLVVKNFDIMMAAQLKYDHDVLQRGASSFDSQRNQLMEWARQQKLAVDETQGNWEAAYAEIERVVEETLQAIDEDQKFFEINQRKWTQSIGENVKKNLLPVLNDLPKLMAQAFTGGGGLSGALKAFGSTISGAIMTGVEESMKKVPDKLKAQLTTSIGLAVAGTGALGNAAGLNNTTNAMISLGTATAGTAIAAYAAAHGLLGFAAGSGAATAAAGALTLGIGAAAVGVALLIKHWWDHHKAVNASKAAVADFEKQIWATLTPAQLIEANGRQWAATLLGVSAAYAATGRSAIQAELDVKALWAASTSGDAAQVQAILDKINQAFVEQKAEAEALTKAIEKYGLTWRDLKDKFDGVKKTAQSLYDDFFRLVKVGYDEDAVIKAMSKDLNQFIIDSIKAGQGIPPALQPIIEKLITTGLLTHEAAAAMLGLEDGVPTLDDLKSAADRYGLELDSLGPKVRQISINATAAQLASDWQLFIRASADMNAVLKKMGPEIQKVATDALKMGLSIPEGMKPLLQAMIDNGSLVDENGKKMQDLSRFNFTKPLEQMVDALIKKLDELITKFGELNSLRPPTPTLPTVPTLPSPSPNPGGGDGGGDGGGGQFGPQSFGGQPTLFLSNSNGGRSIMVATAHSPKSSGVRGGGGTVILELDGRILAEVLVPELPGAIERHGLGR